METTDKRKMTREEIHALVRALRPEPGRKLTREEIRAQVRGLLPVDWVHVRLLASVSPAERVAAGLRAAEFARMMLKSSLKARYPALTDLEINMKILEHFTGVRLSK